MKSTLLTSIVVLAFAPRVARGDDCRITVVLEGDGVLVDAIDTTLGQRGIATKATAACPTTTALVERRDNAIAVTVTDPSGRRSIRSFDDVDAATSLIETWARQDMNASALIGWTEPSPVIAEAPRVDAVLPPPAASRPRRPQRSIAVAGEASIGFDGTSWLGARASSCARIGPVCAGATVRLATNDSRIAVDGLAGADLPVALTPRVVVLAGVAAGAGGFRSTYFRGEAPTTITKYGVRLDAHAALDIAVARYVSLHLGISVGGSPQAPMTVDAGGDMPIDNNEPGGFLRADIGLRIGLP